MSEKFDYKLLYQLAAAYYEEGLTQNHIARRFGLSRIKVSRLLQAARDLKIVQITIRPIHEGNVALEYEICRIYGIPEVVTVSPAENSREGITKALGNTAAEYLIRRLRGDEVIAITWGSTLNAVIKSLPTERWERLRVVQGLGGLSSPEAEVNGTDQARRMAQVLGGRPILLAAPGIVASKSTRDALLLDANISKVLGLAAEADYALIGIGVPTPGSVILQNQVLTSEEVDRLKARGAAGDIGLRFFNEHGEKVPNEIEDRIIGLDLDQLKGIRRVVAIAGGREKIPAIRAALRGRLMTTLITDEQTASCLVEEEEQPTDCL